MNLLTIGSFFAFTSIVAFISYLKTRDEDYNSTEGYFLGGRSLTAGVIAGSLLLTNLSTEQLIGLNGISFSEGVICVAWETIASLTMVILALYFLPRYLKSGITTIPQFLEDRFDSSIRTMANVLFLCGYVFVLLPIVLYSGALGVSGIFDIPQTFGISIQRSVWICVFGIGIIGSIYAIFGGLKAVAISDTINGIGLLIGGLIIPYCGLSLIGDGNIIDGFATLMEVNPEKFNAIGQKTDSVPFSTIFTGMLLVNMFYWCTNQVIVQRVLAARNLQEGQKGVLLAGAIKLLSPTIAVLPGIIAFHLYGDIINNGDLAYPTLVKKVLPAPLVGFFAAVLVGAILSSFNSTLNSASTLFSIGIYKKHINPAASESRVVKSGKIFCTVLAIISMFVAPLIAYAPHGLFGYLQEVNGCYTIPILTVILMGFTNNRAPSIAAKVGLVFGSLLYIFCSFILNLEIHYLHLMFIIFLINNLLMLTITYFYPRKHPWTHVYTGQVDIKPWKYAMPAGIGICTLTITNYLYFSPLSYLWYLPLIIYTLYLGIYISLNRKVHLPVDRTNIRDLDHQLDGS
ncbi:MAG: solute:sodium symporter family transporter [Oligoflexales bacterium]